MQPTASNADPRHGFTLIELIVVLVLIGIMAAMIVPEMKGTYEDALLRSSSRELVDAFSLASSRAISVHQRHRVRFDKATGRYAIERRAQEPGEPASFIPVREVPGTSGKIDQRITVTLRPIEMETDAELAPGEEAPEPVQADEAVAFYPDGTADAVEVLLRDRSGFGLALRINPITARVHVAAAERP